MLEKKQKSFASSSYVIVVDFYDDPQQNWLQS